MKTTKPFIFLVDDDKDDRQLFTEALDDFNSEATIATFENGVDLMANLLDSLTALPDIIFLDLNMPLMNGEECLTDIRAEADFKDIPIIIYSGYHDDHKINLLQEKGADRYLEKPRSFLHLKYAISDCFDSLNNEKDSKPNFTIKRP